MGQKTHPYGFRLVYNKRWHSRWYADSNYADILQEDLKLRQMHEMLQGHLTRRKVDSGALDYQSQEQAAGQAVRQKAIVRQGIDRDLAKKLVKELKGSKIKVQVAIQGDELRVTGKKRDDLQAAISHIKGLKGEVPLQFVNMRD